MDGPDRPALTHYGMMLSQRDVDSLDGHRWLTSKIVNFCIKHLEKRHITMTSFVSPFNKINA